MEKFLNVVRSNNMVQAVLCIAFGLFLMIYPSITVQGIIMLFGVALALMGAAGLLSYFRQRSVRYRDSGTLMAAVFYVIIAIIAFVFPKVIAGFFSVVLGVVLILLARIPGRKRGCPSGKSPARLRAAPSARTGRRIPSS